MTMMTMKNVFLLTLALPAAFAFAPVSIPNNNALLLKTTSLQMSSNPFDALKNIFSSPQVEEIKPEPLPDVIINPDFTLAGIFLAAGLLLDTIPYIQLTLGPIITLLGILFAVQATRVRFVFDETSFELKIGNDLNDAGENFVVGGENRWTYDSFVNWEFFPKGWIDQPQGPVLVYFKETQTPSEKWMEGPGESANSEEAISKGAVPGQVHFFPVICDAKQLREEFQKRGCPKLPATE